MEVFTPTITKVSEDARGEVYVITLPGDKELLLLHSVEGSLRGGHSHDVDEVVVMIIGRMAYYKRNDGGSSSVAGVIAGDASFNPVGVPHMGKFLEDSWLLEWKINTNKTGWKNTDYAPWRKRVRANAGSK